VRRRGGLKAPLIIGVLVVMAGAVALGGVPSVRSSVARLFASSKTDVIKYRVSRGTLPVVVNERGSLESSSNMDVTNTVEGMTTIIMIRPEGTRVSKGDLVCELDSANLRDQLTTQVITTKRAFADLEQAQKTREVAEIAVTEYLEGTFPMEEESNLGNIKLAEADLVRARERAEWSDKMLKIGYVTASSNSSDHLTLQKMQFSLSEARTKLKVLKDYTRDKQVKELQANVEKALSDELAKKATYELEKSKEEKLNKQITACKLYAPGDGLVVYANEANRFGSNQPQIEEGASVRERQKIFSLPDISKMRVNTKVHESMVDRVRKGLKARIRVDAFAQQVLDGTVENVQPLPDPTSFFASDVKVYTTLVTIDNPLGGLRPGMTAQVEILVTQLDDVLSVPVQAVLEFKGKDYVYVARPDGEFVRREIKKGTSNDKLLEVKDGLQAGEEVALSPMLLMTEAEKREAFAISTKGEGKEGWSADAVKAGNAPGEGGPDAKGKAKGEGSEKGKARRKGGGGMAALGPIFQKLGSLPEDERAKLRDPGLSEDERSALMKKAGVTDAEIAQMKQAMEQMKAQGGFGGGGPGGPGGGGGFGGGGGGGRGPQGGGPQ
jgi:RND family efflux transporter MFP subunit